MHFSNTFKEPCSSQTERKDRHPDVARFYDQHIKMHLIELHKKRMRQMQIDSEVRQAQCIIDLCDAAAAAGTTGPMSVEKAREILASF